MNAKREAPSLAAQKAYVCNYNLDEATNTSLLGEEEQFEHNSKIADLSKSSVRATTRYGSERNGEQIPFGILPEAE